MNPLLRGPLSEMAESVRSRGRAGDDILVHVNPEEFDQMQGLWGEPSYHPETGLPEYGFMSKLKKALKKANPVTGYLNPLKTIKDNWVDARDTALSIALPGTLTSRDHNGVFGDTFSEGSSFNKMFVPKGITKLALGQEASLRTGANDIGSHPLKILHTDKLSNAIWNKALGRHDRSPVNALGSPSRYTWEQTQADNPELDLQRAQDFQQIGDTIAGLYGGSAAVSALGGIGGGGSAAADVAAPAAEVAAPGATGVTSATTLGPLTVTAPALTGGDAALAAAAAAPQAFQSHTPELGQTARSPGLLQRATNYATNPENWDTIATGLGALGTLGGGGGGNDGAPFNPGNPQQMDMDIRQRALSFDDPESYYTYGSRAERPFYADVPPENELAEGGMPLVRGAGTGRSDSIPAQLSDGEYVIDAETVALLGDGSTDAGANRLDEMRKKLRMQKGKQLSQGKFSSAARLPEQYLGEE